MKKYCKMIVLLVIAFAIFAVIADENQNSTAYAEEFAIGSYVTFGSYPQTTEGNDNTPIEWLVLDRDGDKAFLLSRYGLDVKPYNTNFMEITWEDCTLRTWLNDEFFNCAFTLEEQTAILLTYVDNSSSQGYYSTNGGNDTQDKVFLLSYAEANKYLDLDKKLDKPRVAPTAYAIAQGAWTSKDLFSGEYKTSEGKTTGRWWLRSMGRKNENAFVVRYDGLSIESYVHWDENCVRPAIWVDVSMISGNALSAQTIALTEAPTVTPTTAPTVAPTDVTIGDSEASLRAILKNQCGSDNFCVFAYGDYDGNGSYEAFALVGSADEWGMTGDIWFVSAQGANKLQSGKSYCRAVQLGDTAPILFTAEENYGGSGSTEYLWCVSGGVAKLMDGNALSGFSYSGSGNEYYAYPDAFDGMDDGSGHTWKQYYFYLDASTLQMREYGGIYIDRSEFEAYANASSELQNAEANGFEIREIIYRANGIVNVNLHSSDGENRFLTFRLNGNEAVNATPTDNQGYYLLASNPSIAVYPSAIGTHTSVQTDTQTDVQTGVQLSAADGRIFNCDLDGDGNEEQLQLTYIDDDGIFTYYINIADASGNVIAQENLFESADFLEHDFTISKLNGSIYIEAHESFEGTATHYIVLDHVNGSYELSKHICDPDPSDGTEVRDALTGKDLYESEALRDTNAIKSTLEDAFSEYDLRFRITSDNYLVVAIISDEDVICMLEDGDIIAHSESSVISTAATEPVSVETSASEAGSATTATFTASGNVNLRSGPNKSSSVITMVSKGNSGTYLGKSATDSRGVVWYYVQYNGSTGWVSSAYAVLNDGSQAVVEENTQSVQQSSAQGSFTVSGGNTNIRSQPNLNGSILGSIRSGHSGEYLGETATDSRGVDWYKIRYKGITGWVSSKYAYLH